jgi:tripartite-type tricarboxylate transporter receptor subunit TctC
MRPSRRRFLRFSAAVALTVVASIANAQVYPERPVHVIVGFPASSGPDIVARLLGQSISVRLGQQFVIEDRPGAGSSIAAQEVVSSPADGHTLFMATAANTINASLYPNLKFDFASDLAPVAATNGAPFVMVINPSLPAKTVPEFIAYARENPGKINIASAGIGTTPHLAYELLKMMTGIELVHVPYRGSYVADLIGGQVQAAFSTIPQSIQYVRDGKLRALAVTSAVPAEALPGVPPMREFVPGYEANGWFGIVAPKRTPAEIIGKLNGEINAVLADPKVKDLLTGLGTPPMPMTPAEFGKLIADYTNKWANVIRVAGIRPE